MPKMRTSVAIITRTKDRPIMLKRSIQSVMAQTFEDWHLVIVNDGGEAEPVEQAVKSLPASVQSKVTVIHNAASVGMEAASNIGIHNSDSRYVVIHDDDDTWEPRYLEVTVGFLESPFGQNFGAAATRVTKVTEEIRDDEIIIMAREPWNKELKSISLAEMSVKNRIVPISVIYRRAVHDEVGMYDERLPVLGDWEFYLRLLMKFDIYLINEALANYHQRTTLRDGVYSNTIFGGHDKHILYDAVVRNRLFREDVSNGVQGLGYLVNAAKMEDSFNEARAMVVLEYAKQAIVRQLVFNQAKQIAIYGTGEFARTLYTVLNANHLKVAAFIDSNREKWGTALFDLPVQSISDARTAGYDAIVIGSYSFMAEIAQIINDEYTKHGMQARIISG